MKAFRFPLERVLDWRSLQLRSEEEKLAVLQNHLDSLENKINTLTSMDLKTEWGLLKLQSVSGSELQALTGFQERVKRERAAIEIERSKCEKQVIAQRARLLKARKEYRVIEKLKEKRHKAWLYLNDRELETLAAESHFSKLIRAGSEE